MFSFCMKTISNGTVVLFLSKENVMDLFRISESNEKIKFK